MQAKRREFIHWVEGFGFGAIILLGWLAEVLGMPHLLFAEADTYNWSRPIIRTAVVLCVWALVHVATRRLLKRLYHLEEYLRICAWCRKLNHEGKWMTMENYFGSAYATKTSHGVCPECSRMLENPTSRSPISVRRH